ncbi:MAG: Hsp20/alpha crystallin family protein [Candidatus Marinimicrobia bacterium]|nr:Hsp20/alpha crystallin family protein [Candidatus Neomarinimicrobiota bacterium]
MTLVKWTPVISRPVSHMMDDMETWMDQIFRRNTIIPGEDKTWTPAFSVSENDKEFVISADLPGMEKKDVEISVEENVLTISGERKSSLEDNSKHYSEIFFGKFSRSFTLPENVKENEIQATFKNGALTLNLPKAEPIKPVVNKIAIK